MSTKYSTGVCRTALSVSKLPGLRYSLNPYVGCEHGCRYCYVPDILGGEKLAFKWGSTVKAKKNIAEVLAREVMKKPKGIVGVSTICDPYQPIEAKLMLTRRCIEILAQHDFPVSIQTKSKLVLRDADMIVPEKFDVGVTISTMDLKLVSRLEPGASLPDERVQVLEEFSSRGVETWLFLGPIIPGINDSEESMTQVIDVAARTRSKIIYDRLNPKRWVMDRLAPVLTKERPDLAERLSDFMRDGSVWRQICLRVESICRELGIKCEAAFPNWPNTR
ncbi:MAG TPA: radical SAM protein [Hadesarchaea archaeon]|nr:radical SAM protein [Hadesarchaea archaeon]